MFGDQENGMVLSSPFTLSDSQSRGFSRMYSLCFLHRQPGFLAQRCGYIMECFKAIQKEFKKRATQLFQSEQKNEHNTVVRR